MKKNGVVEHYYDNGQLGIKEAYKDGKKEGIWEEYNWNGSLQSRITYKDDNIKEKSNEAVSRL